MTKEKAAQDLITAQSNYIYYLTNKPGFFSTIIQKKEWKDKCKEKYEEVLKKEAIFHSIEDNK